MSVRVEIAIEMDRGTRTKCGRVEILSGKKKLVMSYECTRMNMNTKNPRYGRRSTQIQKSQSLKYGRSRLSRECTRMNANTKSQKLAADARRSTQIMKEQKPERKEPF